MATTENSEANQIDVVREFHQRVLTEKDLDVVEALVAEAYVEHNPALPDGVLRGREPIVEFWEELFEAFPDLWIKEEDAFAEGDTVVTRHVGRGTHKGEFMGLEPTGNEFEIEGIDVYRIEGGKIAESWINLDMFGMLRQLDAIPTEGPQ